MRIRRNRRLIPRKTLSKRGKQIRLLSFALAGLCVLLAIVSINMLSAKTRLDEQPQLDTLSFPEVTQAKATPKLTPQREESASAPATTPRPVVLQDVEGYPVIAKLSIEKLSLELPILSKATDEALKIAPCLFIGPSNPNDAGNMVITGHNNKDGSQFGKLKALENGDIVTLMDKWGDTFTYEVYDIETIKPDDMAALDNYDGEHALALVTCTSNGNRRLLLRCRMIL